MAKMYTLFKAKRNYRKNCNEIKKESKEVKKIWCGKSLERYRRNGKKQAEQTEYVLK